MHRHAIRRTEQREALHPRGREARSWHVCTGACHEPPHRRHRCWLWACPALNQGGGARVPGGSPERVLHHGPAHRPPHRHVGTRQLFRLCLAASRLAYGTLTPSAPCSCSVTCCRSVNDPLRTHAPPRAANPAARLGDHARRNHTPANGTPGPNHPLHQSSSPHLTPIRPGTWCSSAPLTPPAEIGGGFDRPFLEHGALTEQTRKKNVSLKNCPADETRGGDARSHLHMLAWGLRT